ncbi:phosphodiester glycosidase family protein [bacterium]|nr:phosphodiester glycosidase family protein [bacterium]
MDTTLLWSEKRVFNAVGVALNFFIIGAFTHSIFVPIMANDLIAKISNPILDTNQVSIQIINEVSSESRSKKFEENIKRKYPNAIIIDVDRGIKHIQLTKYYDKKPVKINVVEVDAKLAKEYEIAPALAAETLHNKEDISNIAEKTNSIIALNGTFFKPQTGVPLGTLMIDRKLYTGPIYDRVALGIFDNGYDIARVKLNASLKSGKKTVKIDNINQPRMLATYTLAYTTDWGKVAPSTPKYGLQLSVEEDRITNISTAPLEIPTDGYVIAGPASFLSDLKIGDKVSFEFNTNPEWKNVKHIISGGPYLVKNGEVFVDMTAEKLGAIGGKNPRSAVGYTQDGTLILVAVDGREGSSVGMTLMQLANFMKSIDCVQAINLDGGGSTVMYVDGKVVNNPQHQGGIPISNAIVLSRKS